MPHLVDRSRIEVDWTCERRRYWNTEFGRTREGVEHHHPAIVGIVPVEEALELSFGSALHSALSSLALQTLTPERIAQIIESDIRLAYARQTPEKQQEAVSLALGLFWGFTETIWPNFLSDYEIIAVEREMTLPADSAGRIQVMVKPDLIVRRRTDNTHWYLEYKSTGFKTQNWIEGWRYAIQLHVGCLAAEKVLGVPVEGAQIIGFYKGYPKDNKLRSPFTYAYHLEGVPGVVPERWSCEWTRGWELLPVHLYPGGMQAWVREEMDEELLIEQFPCTGPIPVRKDIVATFLAQLERRENQVLAYHAGMSDLDTAFPQRFKSCRPLIGKPCPYIECCFSPSVAGDPIGSGLYQPRQPHHNMEVMELEGEG